ncbi:MAG: amidase [Geodermatophilaceae bacterium]|nr:amidase [Geodermatophilaceae bacterium]
MTQPHELSALDQAAAIRERAISPVELVEHYLDRITALDRPAEPYAGLGAFFTVTSDQAREQAAEAERAVLAGAALSPLHGIPTAIKDLNLTAGVTTTFGSATMRGFVPDLSDVSVERLRAAGTISLGKTSTPEFGFPCYTEPAFAGPARNPWDTERLSGGSSGGAATAVAAGLVPIALGSDGGGSIRIPASCCGIFGIKTSRGRISSAPLGADTTGLSSQGPLARTVRDAAAMLDLMAGMAPGDPHWAPPLTDGETFLSCADRDLGRLRIGRYLESGMPRAEVEPAVEKAWQVTSALLESLGHDVEDLPNPPLSDQVVTNFEKVWSLSGTTLPITEEQAADLQPLTSYLRDRGLGLSAKQAMEALFALRLFARRWVESTAAYDVILAPVCSMTPRPIGWFAQDGLGAPDFERQKLFAPYTAVYNVTGQPAVSVPLHWTEDGLPIGSMLVGRPSDEATLIALSAQLEQVQPWAFRRPPVW